MSNHCCYCGQFVKHDADSSTPFGRSYDVEPRAPEYYCEAHAKSCYEYHVKNKWLPTNWIKSDWERRAAETLGYEEHYREGYSWSIWRKPVLPLPAHECLAQLEEHDDTNL